MATFSTFDNDKILIAELVIAAQGGSREAFGELFERFEQQVFAIALRRLGDFGEAQELCQDVFVQAMVKLDQLREAECFGAWIRSIAHRMAINRAVRRTPDLAAEPAVLEAAGAGRRDAADQRAGGRASRAVAGTVWIGWASWTDRRLEAFYVEGRSLQEMSGDFQAPLGTIKRRLHVARKRLAKQVEPLTAV